MRSNRADALEGEAFPKPRGLWDHYRDLVESLTAIRTTRRAMMVGAAGLSAGLPLIGPLVRAACCFTCDADSHAFRVFIGGIEVWKIDRRWFDGIALLHVEQSASHLHVQLRQARFPGTDLPADLCLKVERGGTGWYGRLVLDGLKFDASFPFHTWLLGYHRATGEANIGRIAFRGAGDVRLDGVHGHASFGPDWTLDLGGLHRASMRIGHEETALQSLRIELNSCRPAHGKDALPVERLTDIWPIPAEGQSIGLEGVTPRVSVGSAHAVWFIRASSSKTVRVMMRLREGPAHLHWPGPSNLRLKAQRVDYTLDYADQSRKVQGAAVLPTREWHDAGALAVEFASDESDGKVWLVANDASPGEVSEVLAMASPRASRFVVSLPGCDAAMFKLRPVASGSAARPAEYGAGISSLAHCVIPLDDYDLVIRRASDAFAATLRFKHIDLRLTSNGWVIVARPESAGAMPLIEYDFGSQHLMEQAVYISDWACIPASGCKKAEDMPVPEPLAALAILRALCDGRLDGKQGDLTNSPVSAADLKKAGIGPDDLDKLLEKLGANGLREKFAEFRRSEGLRNFLRGSQPGVKGRVKTERAGASRLLFSLAPGARIPLTLQALLSWAAYAPPLPDPKNPPVPLFIPVLPRRALAAGTEELPGESEGQAQSPTITRPLSLGDPLSAPFEYATGIEVPARLVMSPIAGDPASWIQSMTQPTSAARGAVPGRNELWNVRLTATKVRAVFSPDARDVLDVSCKAPLVAGACPGPHNLIKVNIFKPPAPFAGDASACEFRASTDARDRHELVALTALYGFRIQGGSSQARKCNSNEVSRSGDGKYVPVPIDVSLLQLTSLGANFKYKGRWAPPSAPSDLSGALSVVRYDHNGQIGRDTLARVEYKGFLFPMGLPAVLIKMTERRFCFETSTSGKMQSVARLVQRFFIVVRAATRVFPALDQPNENRYWGHASIDIGDFTTPDLDKPDENGVDTLGQAAFWPRNLCGEDVAFPFAEPASRSSYTAPQVFVDNNVVNTGIMLAKVVRAWRKMTAQALSCDVNAWPHGDAPGFARVRSGRLPYVPGMHGDNTEVETDRVLLDVQTPFDDGFVNADDTPLCVPRMSARGERLNQPPFFPARRRCRVSLTHVSTITGNASARYLLEYDRMYGHAGFASEFNAGQIFAVFVAPGPVLDFRGDTSRSGGFASPSTAIVYLSAQRGLLGGPPKELVELNPASAQAALLTKAKVKGAPPAATPSHHGDFDPVEFFSAFIGDAKLLGIVRIVDILKVALAATGTKIPTIKRENLFNLTRDALLAIIGGVKSGLSNAMALVKSQTAQAPVVAARLVPQLERLQQDADELEKMLNASPFDEGRMLALLRDFSVASTAFAADVNGLAQHPELLLPPEQQKMLEQLHKAWDALQHFDFDRDVGSWLRPMVKDLIDQAVDKKVAELIGALTGSPEFGRVLQTLRDLQASLTAVIAQVQDIAQQKAFELWNAYLALLAKVDEYHRQAAALLAPQAAKAALIKSQIDQLLGTMSEIGHSVDHKVRDAQDQLTNAVKNYTGQLTQQLSRFEVEGIPKLAAPANTSPSTDELQVAARRELAAVRQFANAFSDELAIDISTLSQLVAPPKGDPEVLNPASKAPRAWALGWDITDDATRATLVQFSYYTTYPKRLAAQIMRLYTLIERIELLRQRHAGPGGVRVSLLDRDRRIQVPRRVPVFARGRQE
ncbi:hypothetical protein ACTJLC_14990 [Paraburkholderia sp. 22099]|uniref:hypothetical protein n=1 Tax=Paraburkholderia sp. 22099 TaxID=3453875 RepID=UPI003F843050